MMRSFIGAALALALATTAHAQSNPGFVAGQVPSASQWNTYFSAKVDLPTSITTGHCLMWGPGIADAGVTCGGGGGGLVVGTSTITSGTNGDVEFNNAGVLGEFALGANVRTALGVALNASGGINTPTPTRAGDIDLWNGSAWTTLAGNNSGTLCLQETASGVPSWAACGGSSGLTVGTTTISGGTPGDIEFNNAGVLGELATTGSGSVVRATSPTLVTPALGTPSSGTLTNTTGFPLANLSGAGAGVLASLAIAPGTTGSSVLQSGAITTGHCLQWNGAGGVQDTGAACGSGGSSSIIIGTTPVTGGTSGNVITNNAGVAGQAAVTPNGTVGFPTIRRITTGTTDTATTSNSTIVIALASPANFAETLPACVSGINGQTIVVKDENGQAGANPITVKATTSTVDTIAGATGFIMNANFQSVNFQCDSAATSGNWMAE